MLLFDLAMIETSEVLNPLIKSMVRGVPVRQQVYQCTMTWLQYCLILEEEEEEEEEEEMFAC